MYTPNADHVLDPTEEHKRHAGHFRTRSVAALLGIDPAHLTRLAKDEPAMFPEQKVRGYVHAADSIHAYARYMRDRNRGRLPQSGGHAKNELQEERLKKLRRENAIESGEVIAISTVESVIREAAVALRTSIDGIAGRVAGGDPSLRRQILAELRGVAVAFQQRLEALASSAPDGGHGDATAGEGSVGVGGATSRAAKGQR